ncbi:DNA polymerase III subunit chi [Phaeovulum sp.]|uniref:DNA polymerase III subunit chi n=1 Tax=Phaeovulum sp. TaxID=2934796 RepID=UPI0039E3AA60
MGTALFYHLTRSPADAVVPVLLTRALAAGWRVELRGTSAERMDWFDQRLWLGAEESFLPHGRAGGPQDARQPVLLTVATPDAAPLNPPAQAIMSLDGAGVSAAEVASHERVWLLFDGNNPAALDHARGQWRSLTAAGAPAEYWSEESGRWEKKAAR